MTRKFIWLLSAAALVAAAALPTTSSTAKGDELTIVATAKAKGEHARAVVQADLDGAAGSLVARVRARPAQRVGGVVTISCPEGKAQTDIGGNAPLERAVGTPGDLTSCSVRAWARLKDAGRVRITLLLSTPSPSPTPSASPTPSSYDVGYTVSAPGPSVQITYSTPTGSQTVTSSGGWSLTVPGFAPGATAQIWARGPGDGASFVCQIYVNGVLEKQVSGESSCLATIEVGA
jgi:hypothetical protein